ncbi:MAG: hypothetical protein K0S26_2980 [Bacteroidota bacterium]|nr:hypothetical protein [Bacteroidota bacterium]
MKIVCLFVLLFYVSCFVYSQEPKNVKFGIVNDEELRMKFDASDSSAEAVLLYEKENIEFSNFNGFAIHTEYFARIKILKTSGLDRGNISLPYFITSDGEEEISDIAGFTYNLENEKTVVTPLTKASVFTEKISGTNYVKKIILPNVKKGSVIEYKFKRRTPFSIDDKPKDWYFQGDIPFKWSELNITIPAYLGYRIIFGGYIPLYIKNIEKNKLDDETKYKFVIKDAPAFKDESFITSRKDYISKVEFELVSRSGYSNFYRYSESWGDIAKLLNKHSRFGEELRYSNYLKKVVNSFSSIKDSAELINAAYSYVKNNFSWNDSYRLLVQDELKTVFENKKGNSSEINLLLLVLLRELGIKANPVILSTRGNGEIKQEYPMLDRFNYVIVNAKLRGKDLLMDATEPFCVPGLLPERCLNNTGYAIEKDTVRLISLQPSKSSVLYTINVELDSLGKQITGDYSVLSASYAALSFRKFLKKEGEKELLNFYKRVKPDWDIESIVTENEEDPFKPFKVKFNFSEAVILNTQHKLYINPLFSENIKENKFKHKERLYPVDLENPYELIVVVNFKVPSNFTIEEIPQKMAITIPDKGAKFAFGIEVDQNVIKIRSHLLVAKSLYSSDQYHYLREFYNTLIQKQAEQIILKKN